MWVPNNDTYKWSEREDKNSVQDFESYKQDLKSVRFYQKCLSGSTYVAVNNLENIYDILDEQDPRTYYYDSGFSGYVDSGSPTGSFQIGINGATSGTYSQYEFLNKEIAEYGMTLKNLFTPNRLISDQISNLFYVDVATDGPVSNIGQFTQNLIIDDIRLKEGHRILVKDQYRTEILSNSIDPDTYFIGYYEVVEEGSTQSSYRIPTSENGIYIFRNSRLERTTDLDEYENLIKYSICAKLGSANRELQFHLQRLSNGFFPEYQNSEPIYFKLKKNWVVRNRMDYNNLFELMLYDTIKHATQSIFNSEDGITYSIPSRTIAVGEFGSILNTQGDLTTIVNNKWKTNLRSIDETETNYWICGDDGTLLKVDKISFEITKIKIDVETRLNKISFFNNLRGVIIGKFNQLWVTSNGGYSWTRIQFDSFEGFNYNSVIYSQIDKFYVGGDNGVFIEFEVVGSEWNAYKRRISRFEGQDDEFLLVEDITSLSYIEINDDPYISIGARGNNIFIYDKNHVLSEYDFIYLRGDIEISDVTSIINYGPTYSLVFSTFDGVYQTYPYLAVPTSFNIIDVTFQTYLNQFAINSIFNYADTEIILVGNNSTWKLSQLSLSSVDVYDNDNISNYLDRLKPKLLFMNYDIGSKLYWFDDYGQYRIPQRFSMLITDLLSSTSIEFRSKSGEISWIDYWKDRQKTFGYASGDMSNSTTVEPSFLFRQDDTNSGTWSYVGSDVTISYDANVMPLTQSSRFRPPSTPTPGFVEDLYFYDYLGVWKNPGSQVGDVILIKSDIVEGKFIINRVEGSYSYFFTDFNENIITNLSQTIDPIYVKNLNLYNSTSQDLFMDVFNRHYISNAYGIDTLEYSATQSSFEIFGKYSRYSAYYNLEMEIDDGTNTTEINYPSGFLNFGYTPTYNLLSYLTFINPALSASKEFLSLPVFENIPWGTTVSNVYIDIGIPSHNKIRFGTDLKHIWDSLLLWTFVDVEVTGSPNILKEGLIIVNKYFEENINYPGLNWIIEFHDLIGSNWASITDISIRSRRRLDQISRDLQYFNNFHRPEDLITDVYDLSGSPIVSTFSNYETEIKYKIPTDSYVKAMLSDTEFFESITGVIYTDYKNELAIQIAKLDREYEIDITSGSASQITLSDPHNLVIGDSVSIEYTGTQSVLTPSALGYRSVTSIINEYTLEIDATISFQLGLVLTYTKKDPFLNFEPIDIFDLGVGDKKVKQAVEITPDKWDVEGSRYFLQNMDFNKFRYRLIDGLDLETLSNNYQWILEAEIKDAIIGYRLVDKELVWYKGIWECGRWFGGRWISGTWKSGDWYGGTWESKKIKDNFISVGVDDSSSNLESSKWFGGRWFGGIWNAGTWYDGRWYDGIWSSGRWYDGTWNDGTWKSGDFLSGIWVLGEWSNGIFNTSNGPAFWLDGKFMGGDFENGVWYSGEFNQLENGPVSRFGTKAINTRNANWLGGKFIAGQFHSYLNLNDDGDPDVSDIHKYSNWHTGFFSGDFYGGNAYNINFNSGVWHGGILNDLEIVGINSTPSNTFLLSGIWRFNIGDQFYVTDDLITSTYSVFGSTQDPIRYRVIDTTLDEDANTTEIYVDRRLFDILSVNTGEIDTGLKLVSRFSNSFFNSGIWFNGVFESGYFNGGMWYMGNFSGNWG